jgi:hypothetical protein
LLLSSRHQAEFGASDPQPFPLEPHHFRLALDDADGRASSAGSACAFEPTASGQQFLFGFGQRVIG